jgi:hypothetical protein
VSGPSAGPWRIGLKRFGAAQSGHDEADSGAIALIQRFGSAANLNIHLHGLVLGGVYRCDTEGEPVFVEVPAPTDEELQRVLLEIINRPMKLLTCKGALVEDQGQTWMADSDGFSVHAAVLRQHRNGRSKGFDHNGDCWPFRDGHAGLLAQRRFSDRGTIRHPRRPNSRGEPCHADRRAGRYEADHVDAGR